MPKDLRGLPDLNAGDISSGSPSFFVVRFSTVRKYGGQIDFRGDVNRGIKEGSLF